jgi:hypothetical protein
MEFLLLNDFLNLLSFIIIFTIYRFIFYINNHSPYYKYVFYLTIFLMLINIFDDNYDKVDNDDKDDDSQ